MKGEGSKATSYYYSPAAAATCNKWLFPSFLRSFVRSFRLRLNKNDSNSDKKEKEEEEEEEGNKWKEEEDGKRTNELIREK